MVPTYFVYHVRVYIYIVIEKQIFRKLINVVKSLQRVKYSLKELIIILEAQY